MKENLEKIISRFVVRKYPFIEDFEIKIDTFRPGLGGSKKIGTEKYTIIYYIAPDEDGNFTVTEDFKEVFELTETYFNALGPNSYQRLDDIEFYSNED